MPLWGSTHKETAIAFDIGTSSVSAAVFAYSSPGKTSKPEILAVHRTYLDSLSHVRPATLQRQVLKSVRTLLPEALKSAGHAPKHIVAGLAAPFYSSRTVKLTSTRAKPGVSITADELRKLLATGEAAFRKEQKVSDLVLFTVSALKVFVNGYRVPHAVGVTGKTLDIFARYEATTRAFKEDVLAAARALVPGVPFTFTTIPTACVQVLSSRMNLDDGLMFIDIGGDITELSIINNGVLERVITIPIGGTVLVRRAAESFHVSYQDARFLLHRLAEGALEPTEEKKLRTLFTEIREDWKIALATEMTSYGAEQALPRHILLTGGGALLTAYTEILTPAFLATLGILGTPHVNVFMPESLQDAFSHAQAFGGPEDTGLACLVLMYAHDAFLDIA